MEIIWLEPHRSSFDAYHAQKGFWCYGNALLWHLQFRNNKQKKNANENANAFQSQGVQFQRLWYIVMMPLMQFSQTFSQRLQPK